MKRLHVDSLGISTTTDVLTFDLRDNPQKKDAEGAPVELDTVICVDEARRRAAEFHHPLQHELLLYCLHSLLHVQGYNDTTRAQSDRMHAREDELLTAIGVGPVFSKSPIPNLKSPNRKSKLKNRKSAGGVP